MQRIPYNSHQPSINPNPRRLQPVASSSTHSVEHNLSLIEKPNLSMEIELEINDETPFFIIRPFPIKESEKDVDYVCPYQITCNKYIFSLLWPVTFFNFLIFDLVLVHGEAATSILP